MQQLVVFECRQGPHALWAWGLVDGAAGFLNITYTEPDGMTFADVEGQPPTLGRCLFTVQV